MEINWNSSSHLKNFTQAELEFQKNLMAGKENFSGLELELQHFFLVKFQIRLSCKPILLGIQVLKICYMIK